MPQLKDVFTTATSTKFQAIFDMYRTLTSEYRNMKPHDGRRESLRSQIELYYERSGLIRTASSILTWAEFAFLATIVLASIGAAFPQAPAAGIVGAIALLAGLLLLAIAAGLELKENKLSKHATDSEIREFDDLHREVSKQERRVA